MTVADLHQQLLDTTHRRVGHDTSLGRALRAVIELHAPEVDEWDARCTGCLDAWGEYSHWPCATTEAIARELGIEAP